MIRSHGPGPAPDLVAIATATVPAAAPVRGGAATCPLLRPELAGGAGGGGELVAFVPVGDRCRARGWSLVAKDVVDRLVAGLLLVIASPLLVAMAVAVRATSPGGVLFRQERVGRDGRPFTILKIRTMAFDAEAGQARLAERHPANGLLFKVTGDPRVTTVGRLLRRTSLDELPQLWNVLRGDMSLVGPRPLPVRSTRFTPREHRRHLVRPGLTGLWQVSGRSDLPWHEAIGLDLHYVEHWSLALDLRILARTPLAVLRGTGAR